MIGNRVIRRKVPVYFEAAVDPHGAQIRKVGLGADIIHVGFATLEFKALGRPHDGGAECETEAGDFVFKVGDGDALFDSGLLYFGADFYVLDPLKDQVMRKGERGTFGEHGIIFVELNGAAEGVDC